MPHVMVPVLCAQEDGREACLCEPDEEWGVHGGGRAARVAAQRWGQLLGIPDLKKAHNQSSICLSKNFTSSYCSVELSAGLLSI
jgi:hypothetical protein